MSDNDLRNPVAMFRMSCPTISAICNNSVDDNGNMEDNGKNTNDPKRLPQNVWC